MRANCKEYFDISGPGCQPESLDNSKIILKESLKYLEEWTDTSEQRDPEV
jgi:hypothetical protein